jgi:hypothetical protein
MKKTRKPGYAPKVQPDGKPGLEFICLECGMQYRTPREECCRCGGADIDLNVGF